MASKQLMATLAGGVAIFFLGFLLYGVLLMDFFLANTGSATGVMKEVPTWWALVVGQVLTAALLVMIMGWRGDRVSRCGPEDRGARRADLGTQRRLHLLRNHEQPEPHRDARRSHRLHDPTRDHRRRSRCVAGEGEHSGCDHGLGHVRWLGPPASHGVDGPTLTPETNRSLGNHSRDILSRQSALAYRPCSISPCTLPTVRLARAPSRHLTVTCARRYSCRWALSER